MPFLNKFSFPRTIICFNCARRNCWRGYGGDREREKKNCLILAKRAIKIVIKKLTCDTYNSYIASKFMIIGFFLSLLALSLSLTTPYMQQAPDETHILQYVNCIANDSGRINKFRKKLTLKNCEIYSNDDDDFFFWTPGDSTFKRGRKNYYEQHHETSAFIYIRRNIDIAD